jgi:hypothetical protein
LHPDPYRVKIRARGEARARLIDETFAESIDLFVPFEQRLDEEDKTWVTQNRGEGISRGTLA